eukprot:1140771-Pelagomonas_calceolata.AAC.14
MLLEQHAHQVCCYACVQKGACAFLWLPVHNTRTVCCANDDGLFQSALGGQQNRYTGYTTGLPAKEVHTVERDMQEGMSS